MSRIYNPGRTYLHPRVDFFHDTEELSDLIVKLFPVEFLYNEANEDLQFLARVKVEYKITWLSGVTEDYTEPDTASVVYTFDRNKMKDRFYAQIPLKAKTGNQYHVKVVITDLNRKFSITNYYRLDKRNKYSQQNFQVFQQHDNYLLTSPYVVGNNLFRLKYAHDNPDSIYVSYYNYDAPLPKISSATPVFKNKPDSTWKWPYTEKIPYMIPDLGLYHIRIDTSQSEGLTILNFGEFYPLVKRPEEMIPPIQYLTNNFEYQNITQHKNVKLAIDNFWLSKAENIERARELIRIYYNRVYFSNYYFTSTREGWKTDRGMVYIIYGPPEAIYKTADKEEWIYFPENSQDPFSYFFTYHESPFSMNEYRLSRSESETAAWKDALQAWQKGDIFKISN
jgi:GWxTD domain-containing protein